MRLRLLVPVLLLAGAIAPQAASARLVVGMSDQRSETFGSALYRAAGFTHARYIVPYDVATDPDQAARFTAWLDGAESAGQVTLVSFEHSRKSRAAAAKLPSPKAFEKAIKQVKARWGAQIDELSPWNEVNRKLDKSRGEGQPTWNRPDMAARYYGVTRRVFKGRPIAALDVLDQNEVGPAVKYIAKFKAAVKAQKLPAPKVWGLHPYSDINRFSTKRTRALLKATGSGTVWLTEASGIVRFGTNFPFSEKRAAAANRCMFTIAKLNTRIKRLYVFGWAAGGSFDSGLVDEAGNARPGYDVVKKRTAGRCKRP